MRRLLTAFAFALAATPALAQSGIALRDMGSFHVGGRIVEITGQPVKEVEFTPGGVPASRGARIAQSPGFGTVVSRATWPPINQRKRSRLPFWSSGEWQRPQRATSSTI